MEKWSLYNRVESHRHSNLKPLNNEYNLTDPKAKKSHNNIEKVMRLLIESTAETQALAEFCNV